jgi:hypothetical protein
VPKEGRGKRCAARCQLPSLSTPAAAEELPERPLLLVVDCARSAQTPSVAVLHTGNHFAACCCSWKGAVQRGPGGWEQ